MKLENKHFSIAFMNIVHWVTHNADIFMLFRLKKPFKEVNWNRFYKHFFSLN